MFNRSQPTNFSNAEGIIDLRSDTVTKLTEAMYERMRMAPLGDDGLDGDPTVLELEILVADLLGKESGLFVPTCTMANFLALLAQTRRSEQILMENNSHIYNRECGIATFSGLFFRPVQGINGAMDIEKLEEIILLDQGNIDTSMICLETSHNAAGGAILPMLHMQTVAKIAKKNNLIVHLDGARIFNAAVAQDVTPGQIASFFDTVSICLSKGLSAPAGAVLVGSESTISKAKKVRKTIGGTQRQIGLLGAAGIEAIKVMRFRLSEDHATASRLSQSINAMQSSLSAQVPETNIVQIDTSKTGRSSQEWVTAMANIGILSRSVNQNKIRCVTHRHIDNSAIDRTVTGLKMLLSDSTCA